MMALLSKAPLLPIAHYGHENYKERFRKIRRTELHVTVGQPFKLITSGDKTNSEVRQRMTDEIMYQLAALLPATHRGVYADLSKATENYLIFTHPASSNLPPHAKKPNIEL